jgi:geranylgeranyl reductase family protein
MFDAIVIGMGPAGATASYHLGSSGLKVLAFEQRFLPRAKLCAGAISAKALRLLDFDFSAAIEQEVKSAYIRFSDGRSVEEPNHDQAGYVVDRRLFDNILAARARDCGVEVHDNERVLKLEEREGHIRVSTDKSEYGCRALIGADGANGITAKYLGRRKNSSYLGVEVHVPKTYPVIVDHGEKLGFFFGDVPSGYGWIFPRRFDASIGIFLDSKYAAQARDHLKKFLAKINIPEDYADRARGHFIPLFSPFMRKPFGKRNILLAGDAASFVDPVTAEGIYYALKSGRDAAFAILNSGPGKTAADIYKHVIEGGILQELRAAWKIAKPLYAFPALGYRMFHNYKIIREMHFQVMMGKGSYSDLLAELKKMAKGIFRPIP